MCHHPHHLHLHNHHHHTALPLLWEPLCERRTCDGRKPQYGCSPSSSSSSSFSTIVFEDFNFKGNTKIWPDHPPTFQPSNSKPNSNFNFKENTNLISDHPPTFQISLKSQIFQFLPKIHATLIIHVLLKFFPQKTKDKTKIIIIIIYCLLCLASEAGFSDIWFCKDVFTAAAAAASAAFTAAAAWQNMSFSDGILVAAPYVWLSSCCTRQIRKGSSKRNPTTRIPNSSSSSSQKLVTWIPLSKRNQVREIK